MKNILLVVVIGAALLLGVYLFTKEVVVEQPPAVVSDYKNATYIIEGQPVTLIDGVSETALEADSSTTVVTRYFGKELFQDLNNDGREDVVFLLTQNNGGSGTFYYAVAALNTGEGYVGSKELFLGDRISPLTIESRSGAYVVVNYLDRGYEEPMTASPSIEKSGLLTFHTEAMQFGGISIEFEGEVDTDRKELYAKEWVWKETEFNDGRTIKPTKPGLFTLTFLTKDLVKFGTDCNSVGGDYSTDGSSLTFGQMRTTLMYCEGSQETEFLQLLTDTTSFHFTGRGELILKLKYDSGTVTFR